MRYVESGRGCQLTHVQDATAQVADTDVSQTNIPSTEPPTLDFDLS